MALFAAGCDDGAPTAVNSAGPRPEILESTLPGGNARVRVTVLKDDGQPAEGSLVTLVHKGVGPFRYAEVPANGIVTFQNLPNQTPFCAHARSGVALSTPGKTDLYPATLDAQFDEPKGDPTQAPVLTGPSGSLLVTKETYLENCVKTPPLQTPNGAAWLDVALRHDLAGTVAVTVADLLGGFAGIQRGIVLGGQGGGAFFTCDDIPWLAQDCDAEVPPGFLQSQTNIDGAPLSFAKGVPFRIEALGQLNLNGQDVDLVATAGFSGGPLTEVNLDGEQLVCDARDFRNDATGDANVLDIRGKVRYSIGVDYTEVLEPDPSRAVIWFAMTADPGTMRLSTRTVFQGESSTRTFNAEWSVGTVGGVYGCTLQSVWGTGVGLGFQVEAFCSEPVEGMTRVTFVQRGLVPPWISHEFNVSTKGQGSGDSTEDPERSGASRAWISIPSHGQCTVLSGNDDRFTIRL